MKILILYKINSANVRNTILEHLYCFKKYAPNVQYHYYNVIKNIPSYLAHINYDGIILHYTFLAHRFNTPNESAWRQFIIPIKKLHGHKIALVQDDYNETNRLRYLFKEHNIKTVCTILNREKDYYKAYPKEQTGLQHYIPVLTGYIDEKTAQQIEPLCRPYKERLIDIGYRARKLSYNLGMHGQLKTRIAKIFLQKLKNKKIRYDISTTGDTKNVFFGKNWYKFLLNCKTFLGCEGGSSLLDTTGEIKKKVENYVKQNPNATYKETEKACFPNIDNNIQCFILSPRHFEAVITKTCQVLVKGEYNGVLQRNHYIPINKNLSNIDEILKLLKDNEYCQKIIDKAYEDIILSGKYTYRVFANLVINHIRKNQNTAKTDSIKNEIMFKNISIYIIIRNSILNVLIKIFYYGIFNPIKTTGLFYWIKKNPVLYSITKRLTPF